MATGIGAWSTTAADNDDADTDINWAEGQAPSTVNNSARAVMAAVATWLRENGFIEFKEHSHAYASATSTTVAGTDVTAYYTAGRRVRAVASTPGTIYGTVVSSSFSTNTTITYKWDASGALSNEAVAISVNLLSPKAMGGNLSGALNTAKGVAVASATSTDIWAANGNVVHITGTTTITSFGTAPQAGCIRFCIADGALPITRDGTAIETQSGASLTFAAGEAFLAVADTTTKTFVYPFKAPAAATGLVYINTFTASGAAALDITGISSTYSSYLIEIEKLTPATDNADLWLRISQDGGSSFITTSNSYRHMRTEVNEAGTSTASGAADSKIIVAGTIGSGTGEGLGGSIRIFSPATSNLYKPIRFDATWLNGTPAGLTGNGGGHYLADGAPIDAIRLLMSTGNITATARLYGLRAS